MGILEAQKELENLLRTHHVTESDVPMILGLVEGYSEQMNLIDFLKKNPEVTREAIIQKATDCNMVEQFTLCMEAYPPDYSGARKLLEMGADIHYVNELGETLLEDIIKGYPDMKAMNPCMVCDEYDDCEDRSCEKRKQEYDSAYLPAVVRFFLENGYDVTKDGGRFGASGLQALCWSSMDKNILEAAKVLLDAGADPMVGVEDEEDVFSLIDWVMAGCIPVDEDLGLECLYAAYYAMVEAKIKEMDHHQIQWWDAAVGKTIDRVLSCASSAEKAVFSVSTGTHQYENSFEDDIVLDCNGVMLAITQSCHAYVNPCKIPENPIDISDKMGNVIGKEIVDVQFFVSSVVKNRRIRHGSALQIILNDGSKLVVRDNGDQFGEEYCTRFEIEHQ